jgi:DNA-binding LacI/PurR family transcriptional regulator
MRVPRDVSVVGFDDIALAAYATPPLTTVRQPMAELARRAVTYLLDLIDGQSSGPDEVGQTVGRPAHGSDRGLLSPELIVRRTTGPCPFPPVAELPEDLSVEKLADEAPRPRRQAGRR